MQVVVGTPPLVEMEDAPMATPFGIVMAGKESVNHRPTLTESEVKLAFNFGLWTAQVALMLHDSDPQLSESVASQQTAGDKPL